MERVANWVSEKIRGKEQEEEEALSEYLVWGVKIIVIQIWIIIREKLLKAFQNYRWKYHVLIL